MKVSIMLCSLSLLLSGMALIPTPVHAAGWISGAEAYVAPWVAEVEHELLKKEYAAVYASDPRTPQVVVLRKLNEAAKAHQANAHALAQALVRDALAVFEEGVRKHYYTRDEIEPLTKFIRQQVPIRLG